MIIFLTVLVNRFPNVWESSEKKKEKKKKEITQLILFSFSIL